ncbi:hypothetical protein [Nonomuraea basaltis]|uniref:hypothetical protein n=1 Tax=Nonomuraea basaltis TaxID=2495887 RepID=UPI00110C4E8E|nr:hypothetical protein [Nonomuraea basaltis]TMR88610.1 hypothetical protein EJK15_65290 [Nonomuraea basaltis]
MHKRISLGLVGLLTGLILFAASPAVQADAHAASATTTAITAAPVSAAQKLDRWITYAHYPSKAVCHAQGKFLTYKKKLAKAYKCVRKVKIGPFKTYQLKLLVGWL